MRFISVLMAQLTWLALCMLLELKGMHIPNYVFYPVVGVIWLVYVLLQIKEA